MHRAEDKKEMERVVRAIPTTKEDIIDGGASDLKAFRHGCDAVD